MITDEIIKDIKDLEDALSALKEKYKDFEVIKL